MSNFGWAPGELSFGSSFPLFMSNFGWAPEELNFGFSLPLIFIF